MAVAGQVSVKFTADVAEYTKATEKVSRANKAVGDSVAKAAQQGGKGLFSSIAAGVKASEKDLEESGKKKVFDLLVGGGTLALASRGFEMLANSVAKYNANIGLGLTKTEAFIDAAYDIPVTGAVLRLGDALSGNERPSEQIAKVRKLRDEVNAAAQGLMKSTDEKVAASFDTRGLNTQITDQARAQIEENKKLALSLSSLNERELELDHQILTTQEQLREEAKAGHNIEAGMIRVKLGLLQSTLEKTKELEAAEQKRAAAAKVKIDFDTYMKMLDTRLQSGTKGFLGGAVNLFGAVDASITSAVKRWTDGAEKLRSAEEEIRQAAIDRLEAGAALGNDEAKLAAERLKIEGQIRAKREELQKIITNNTLPDYVRQAAEAETAALPELQRMLEAGLQAGPSTAPTATPQLSRQFSTNARDLSGQILDESKKQSRYLDKILQANSTPPKVVNIGN